jgi:exodeoxyribonuclease V beta subunit
MEYPPANAVALLPGGRATGIYLHELFERVDLAAVRDAGNLEAFRGRPDVAAVFARVMRRHDRPESELAASQELVWRALTEPIDLAPPVRLASIGREVREVEFCFPVGPVGDERAFVRGVVDLVFEHDGRIWWLDWKSDVLPDYGPAALARHVEQSYAVQAQLYGLAVARMAGVRSAAEHERRIGGLVYHFVRGGAAHVARPSWDALALGRAELDARLAEVEP